MTTLPQTTSIQLPRPVAPQPLALPGPNFAQPQAQSSMTGGDIWRVIRSNLWLIVGSVVVGLIVGIALNTYLAAYYARYTAQGLVQVQQAKQIQVPGQPAMMDVDNFTTLNVEQRSQSQMMRTDELFTKVLLDNDVRQTHWFASFKNPDGSVNLAAAKEDLSRRLNASPITDSKLIAVSFTCEQADDSRLILTKLISQHIENEKRRNADRTQGTLNALMTLRGRYESRINELRRDTATKAASLQLDGYGRPGGIGQKETELSTLNTARIKAASEAAAAKASYDATMKVIADGGTPAAVEIMVNQAPLVQRWKQNVDDLDVQVRANRTTGTESRVIQQLVASRDASQDKYDQVRAEERVTNTTNYQEQLQSQVASTQSEVDSLDKQADKLRNDLSDMTATLTDYLTKKDEEEGYQELLKRVRDQIDVISNSMSSMEINTVSWASQPERPDSPSFPNLPITLAACIGAGLMLSLGISFFREMFDTSVRSPRDIQRVGNMPILGMVPHASDDPQSSGTALPTLIYGAPTSMIAEQFRQVRTRLQHAASLDTTRSLLVTSPSPEDGKSFVACNLAAGLALNGRKILLVDANFRRPELHKIFGLGNDIGLGNVLSSIDNFQNAIRQTKVPNLDLMTTGPKLANATELLESQLLIDFIERALEEYDHVIFDSGPLLFVSETVALAPRVDGVVTVVRARSNSRGLLQRMHDTLRQVKAEHLGVVLNGVRSTGGGYYGRNIKTYYEYQNAG